MIPAGFHDEWRTIGRHRVHISVRDGFPGKFIRRIARESVRACDLYCSDRARVCQVFYDDTNGAVAIMIASTEERDLQAATRIVSRVEEVSRSGALNVLMELVPRGNELSDHYDHMYHLAQFTFRSPS
jgi:hypothetical protein